MAKKYYCPVCGYESDEPIDVCPVCGAKMAVREEGETSWAAEHKVGIIDGVSEEIVNGLRENFQGECTEVGMYLAMARVAHREGYPEIGLYWEKAAYEEAEHAAKFAEMLGEVVTDSTKKNLEMRAAAENGATLGKTQLAKLAKEQGLDAIHDTVHEMARDEARHGKAFDTVTPVHTVWRRPCSAVSMASAWASSAGLPSFLSSRNTMVSAVMTISSSVDATA